MIATHPAQGRVLAHAAHEIRGAFGAVELCLAAAESDDLPAEDVAGLAETVRAQIQRGMTAIEDLEAFLARRAVRAAREPVDVGALVARRERAWSRLAQLSGAAMVVDWNAPGALVVGDARRLCQALDNLVSNAIGHGGDRIVLRATSDARRLRIEIRDGGAGPPREALAAVPVKPSATHGHGLAIARMAIESCDGRLEAIDGGVAIDLPLDRAPALEAAVGVGAPTAA